jgi:hypothetical protein
MLQWADVWRPRSRSCYTATASCSRSHSQRLLRAMQADDAHRPPVPGVERRNPDRVVVVQRSMARSGASAADVRGEDHALRPPACGAAPDDKVKLVQRDGLGQNDGPRCGLNSPSSNRLSASDDTAILSAVSGAGCLADTQDQCVRYQAGASVGDDLDAMAGHAFERPSPRTAPRASTSLPVGQRCDCRSEDCRTAASADQLQNDGLSRSY